MGCRTYGVRLSPMGKFGTVKVTGSSMKPTLNDGDWLFVSWFESPLPISVGNRLLGKMVVIEREERPGVFLVKRLHKVHAEKFWVQGDNSESSDSRTWGPISANEIVGRVILRYRKSKKVSE